MIKKYLGEQYSPLYFLAALRPGGLSITFFLYLMFMIDHPDTPMVTYNHIFPSLVMDGFSVTSALTMASLAALLFFAALHFRMLAWNIREYRRFKKTSAFQKLRHSNSEVTLMALPLTLSMSINVSFILGVVLVPDLWNIVEYLFPLAIAAYAAVGIYALTIFTQYLSRLITTGDFDCIQNNNLGQMLAIFAFAMVGVGMAAPGAMSHYSQVNAVGIFLSIFFNSIAIIFGIVKFVLGFRSMLEQGIDKTASPTLWITIPILTLLGISFIRVNFGLDHGLGEPISKPSLFILTSVILSLQLMFALIGYVVMKRLGYFDDYIHGDRQHVGSYSLICPGVALFVFGMFFIHFGLIKNGLLEKFSLNYFLLLSPLVWLQIKTILTLFKLNRKLLRRPVSNMTTAEQA